MATGILAMGLMLVAMAFPVGVKLVSVSTERTIGDAAIGEAVAKMRLYGIKAFGGSNWPADPNTACTDYQAVCATTLPADERYYPSLVPMLEKDKRYCWSILVRRTDPAGNAVQTTVLVCRMMGMGAKYYPSAGTTMVDAPVPVKVSINCAVAGKEITVQPNTQFAPTGTVYKFFTEGCTIVEDSTGQICRVRAMQDNDSTFGKETLILQDTFPIVGNANVWVVPPAVGNSRNPCIRVWQSNLTF